MSGAWRKLRELAAKEQDTAKLVELVVEINCLLNVIEIQLAKVAGGGKPTSHQACLSLQLSRLKS